MPERASITQAVQVGVEAVPGTNVAANKLLNSMSLGPAVAVDMQRFRPQGQKFASIITPGKEWVTADVSGVGSYSEVIYALACLLKYQAPVQQAATTAYKWTVDPAARSEDTIKTLTVEQGGAVRAQKFNYGLFNEFGMDFTRDGVSISGAMFGQRLQDGIVLTAAPAAVEEKPILPNEIDIFLDTTGAGLGTTKLTRVLEAGFSVGSRFNPLWTLNSVNSSFAAHVEAEPSAQFRIKMEADAEGMAQLTTMRQGATRFMQIRCTSPDLAGAAIPYSLTINLAGKVSGVGNFEDADGVYAIEWTFDVVYDATWAHALLIDVINKQTAL
jgi:hypothetical protein